MEKLLPLLTGPKPNLPPLSAHLPVAQLPLSPFPRGPRHPPAHFAPPLSFSLSRPRPNGPTGLLLLPFAAAASARARAARDTPPHSTSPTPGHAATPAPPSTHAAHATPSCRPPSPAPRQAGPRVAPRAVPSRRLHPRTLGPVPLRAAPRHAQPCVSHRALHDAARPRQHTRSLAVRRAR